MLVAVSAEFAGTVSCVAVAGADETRNPSWSRVDGSCGVDRCGAFCTAGSVFSVGRIGPPQVGSRFVRAHPAKKPSRRQQEKLARRRRGVGLLAQYSRDSAETAHPDSPKESSKRLRSAEPEKRYLYSPRTFRALRKCYPQDQARPVHRSECFRARVVALRLHLQAKMANWGRHWKKPA